MVNHCICGFGLILVWNGKANNLGLEINMFGSKEIILWYNLLSNLFDNLMSCGVYLT